MKMNMLDVVNFATTLIKLKIGFGVFRVPAGHMKVVPDFQINASIVVKER